MKLTVNGQSHEVSAATLGDLLAELDYGDEWLATAVNASLVHAGDREAHALSDGDEVEILSPMQGG
jgi:thiamine biosynthesis protein ThiS